LPIARDNEPNSRKNIISLGLTKQAQSANLKLSQVKDDGYCYETVNQNIFIVGNDTPDGQTTSNGGDSNGTANGTYSFLEDYLNVRWLLPGDLGRDVPESSNIEIKLDDKVVNPSLYVIRRVSEMTAFGTPSQKKSVNEWSDRQKLGSAYLISINHSWQNLNSDSLYNKHPDWFAMINGKRVRPKDKHFKLETTNPELIKYFANWIVNQIPKDKPAILSISPSDGRGWSQSPQAKAFYDPTPTGNNTPSVSPLVIKWYNDVIAEVNRIRPNTKLSGFLYADYIYPPKDRSIKLSSNFIPVIATSDNYGYRLYRDDVQDRFKSIMGYWSSVIGDKWLYFDLPNILFRQDIKGLETVPGDVGLITPAAPEILNTVFKTIAQDHINGATLYGSPSWSSSAMSNYIKAKLMWTPSLDAVALQKEWLNRAYGESAGAIVNQIYGQVDAAFAKYYQQNGDLNYHLTLAFLKDVYAPNVAGWSTLMDQAQKAKMTDVQSRRLALLANTFKFMQYRLQKMGLASGRSSINANDLLQQNSNDFQYFPQGQLLLR
jgi:hypothetical protein